MTAGGDRPRHTPSGPQPPDDDGLGAFASESEVVEASSAPRASRSWHTLVDSPALVSVVMALAVFVYGGLMVLWWERDPPQVKPAFQGAPTASYRPGPASPAPTPVPAPAAPVATTESRAADTADLFVPAVARAPEAGAARPVEEATVPPIVAPGPPPPPDLAEDAAAIEPVSPPPAPRAAAADAPAAPSPEPAPNAAVAPPGRLEPVAVDRVAVDREAIGDVLRSYRTSYNALDATSVSTIWQGLDTRALQRAFSTLSQQDVSFDRCDVRVTSVDTAVASCRGLLSYVPKIGDGSPQQRRLTWTFDFQRAAGRWLIAAVSAR
jgi:hypothetical protein